MESAQIPVSSSSSLQSLQVGFSSIVDRARRLVFGSAELSDDDEGFDHSGFEEFVDCEDESRSHSILRITESGECLRNEQTVMSAPPGIPLSSVINNTSLLPPPGFRSSTDLETVIDIAPPGISLPCVQNEGTISSLPPGFDVPPGLHIAPPGLSGTLEHHSSFFTNEEVDSSSFTAPAGTTNSYLPSRELHIDSSSDDVEDAPPGLPLKPEIHSSSFEDEELEEDSHFTAPAVSFNTFSSCRELSMDSSKNDVEVAPPGLSLKLAIMSSRPNEELEPTPFNIPTVTTDSLSYRGLPTDSSSAHVDVDPPGLSLNPVMVVASPYEELTPTHFGVAAVTTSSLLSCLNQYMDVSSDDDEELGMYSRKTLWRLGEEEKAKEHLSHFDRLPSSAEKDHIVAKSILAGMPSTKKVPKVRPAFSPSWAPRVLGKKEKRGKAVNKAAPVKGDDSSCSVRLQESSLSHVVGDAFMKNPVENNVDEIIVPSLASLINSGKDEWSTQKANENDAEESVTIEQSITPMGNSMCGKKEAAVTWNPNIESVTESMALNRSNNSLARFEPNYCWLQEVAARNPSKNNVDEIPSLKQSTNRFSISKNMNEEANSTRNSLRKDVHDDISVKQGNNHWSDQMNVNNNVLKESNVNDRFEQYSNTNELKPVNEGPKKRFRQSVNSYKPENLVNDVQTNVPSTSSEFPMIRINEMPKRFKIWNYLCRSCDLSDAARKGTALAGYTEEQWHELYKQKVIEGAGGVYRPPVLRIRPQQREENVISPRIASRPEVVLADIPRSSSRNDRLPVSRISPQHREENIIVPVIASRPEVVLADIPRSASRNEQKVVNISQHSLDSQHQRSNDQRTVDKFSTQTQVEFDDDNTSTFLNDSNTTVSSTSTNTISSIFGQSYQGRSDSKFLPQDRLSIGFGPDRNYLTNVRQYERNRPQRRTPFSRTDPIFTKEEYDALSVHMHKFASDERAHQHVIAWLIMNDRKVSNFDPRVIDRMVRNLVQHRGELCKEEALLKKQFENRLERDGDLEEYKNPSRS